MLVLPRKSGSVRMSSRLASTVCCLLLAWTVSVHALPPSGDDEVPLPDLMPQLEELPGEESGQDPIHETYERQNIREDLTPYGVDLLGERFDLGTGTLSFYHRDVALPGNSGLEVAVRRAAGTGRGIAYRDNEFGDWELDLPRLEMLVLLDMPGWWADDRCTGESDPGMLYKWGVVIDSFEYWNGLKLHIPGEGAKTVLDDPASPKLTGAEKTTKDNWMITCSNVGGSEGFIAVSPDGIKYHLNKLRYLKARQVRKDFKYFGRKRAQMLVTKVEDRFGNEVNYTYSGNLLTSIESNNDNRKITLTYNAKGHVATVVANALGSAPRTWTYGYTPVGIEEYLSSVTLPDGTSWTLNINALVASDPPESPTGACWYQEPRETATGTVIHPHGAKGTYSVRETKHGRADVPFIFNPNSHPCDGPSYIQTTFGAMSLTEKTLEGPGLDTLTWDFDYSENIGGFVGDGADPLKTTTVTNPDGSYTVYHFDRTWSYKEGALIKREVFSATDQLLETTEYQYEAGQSRGFYGDAPYENDAILNTPQQVTQVKVTRGTDVFTTDWTFDNDPLSSDYSFSYPIQKAQDNSFSNYSLTEDTAYLHDTTYWEIGRPTTVHVGTEEIAETIYDGNNRVWKRERYGVQVAEFSYNTNGTLAWQKDALGNQTTFANWTHGIPELITYPDLTAHAFDVDANGWIMESTDRKNQTTVYERDEMGRLTLIDYPDEPGLTRANKVLDLIKVTVTNDELAGSGIEIGQYKHVTTREEFTVTSYLDALFRPVLTRTQDTNLGTDLDRFTRQSFDYNGQVTFASFPSDDAIADDGTDSTFDALGRVTETAENVSPYADTDFEYLAGNKVRVTNPRDKQTTTTYFALGSPDQSLPINIEQPENVTTAITRNDFGEMTEATQSGTGPTVSATRYYYYDAQHRLCRQVDPETGSTAYAYNNANQIDWYAKAASGSSTSCDLSSVPTGEKIVHSYDSMGRLTNVNYPDASPDLTYGFDDNGNLTSLTSSDASWSYTHNAVNALDSETLVTGTQTFSLSYRFDTMDRLDRITYPGSTVIAITPNAYGEPTSVGSYATGIDYWPTGSIKELNYGTQQGTGRTYTTTQNERQLPHNLKVVLGATTLADLTHSYDANANVTSIVDAVNGSGFDRTMGYDDLDRLTTATGFWGSGSYSFDALGNLLTKTEVGSLPADIDLDYTYNSTTNRLTSVDDSYDNADYAFSYDSYGNVTNNGYQGFTYNLAGNMVSSTNPGIAYKYDGHKRRVQKDDGQVGYTVYGQSGKLMHKLKGGVSTHYVYAGSLLIAELQGSTVHYVHTDLLGSPIAGDNGTAYAEHYRPWGEKKDHPMQLADDVGYTGHQDDVATGLTYMQARYYDPVVGRFMATDPVQFAPDNPMSFGRYLYVNGNPYKFNDPDGEFPNVIFGAIVGAVASGVAAAIAGEDIGSIAISMGSGAIIGAATSGASAIGTVTAQLAKVGFSKAGQAVATVVAESAVGGAAGNAVGQGISMVVDAASGVENDGFDVSQMGTAALIAVAGSTTPSLVAGGRAAATFTASEQFGLGIISGVQEGAIGQAIERTAEMYENDEPID